jgi:hypothetical protein
MPAACAKACLNEYSFSIMTPQKGRSNLVRETELTGEICLLHLQTNED